MRRRVELIRLSLAWAATLVLLGLCLWPKSLMPKKEESIRIFPHTDKLVHFGMFAVFTLIWMWALPRSDHLWRRRTKVLMTAFALAVGTEWAQGLPEISRDPDVLDGTADAVGAVVGVGLAALLMAGSRGAEIGRGYENC